MTNKYRLKLFGPRGSAFAIHFSTAEKNYSQKNCRIRAIMESTDVTKHNKNNLSNANYTEPKTIEEVKEYISKNQGMLGDNKNCKGLILEDICRKVDFNKSIQVKNSGRFLPITR